jgi:hypothetical protein
MATTRYVIAIDGANTDVKYSKKDRAINAARTHLAKKDGYVVQVFTEAGTEVFKAARRKVTKFTAPYTKTIDLPENLAALVPNGYVAAYARHRNGAVVLRLEDQDIVEDPSLYAVLDTVAGTLAGYAPTTRDAGKLMKALGASRKTVAA